MMMSALTPSTTRPQPRPSMIARDHVSSDTRELHVTDCTWRAKLKKARHNEFSRKWLVGVRCVRRVERRMVRSDSGLRAMTAEEALASSGESEVWLFGHSAHRRTTSDARASSVSPKLPNPFVVDTRSTRKSCAACHCRATGIILLSRMER